MQKLIADYLFQYKKCALPQIGTLKIKTTPASSIMGEQKITAPVSTIYFTDEITDSRNLTEYIAANKNVSVDEAVYQLKNICTDISSLNNNDKFLLTGVGEFYKAGNGKISFHTINLPAYFAPPVYAERVIHPNDSHAILVGDTETDRNTMAEYYTEDEPVHKSKWWVWAIVLFAVATALIVVYANDKNSNSFFGISHKYDVPAATKTYKKLP
jgi:hypothetical protein